MQSWAIFYKIPHNALKSLLKILSSIPNINLPQDPRTLLRTPRHMFSKSVAPGTYSHIGIKNEIEKIINFLDSKPEKIDLLINIDGLPLSKSSGSQIYPILCSLTKYPQYVSVIGIYHGYEKPNNPNDFLSDFVVEATELSEQGFKINQNHNVPFSIKAFICDAPAKSFITYCISYNGFFSCSKCVQKGKYVKGRVCFPKTNCKKRTNENFCNKIQRKHHVGNSILENIPGINMVSSFPLEYMHLVCLGVVKKMLNLWLFGPAAHKLSKACIEEISNYLIRIKLSIPSDFVRKIRSLNECKRWKATEFRFFLLYCGPIILKDILPFHKYLHFISLHVAIRILINIEYHNEHLDYAVIIRIFYKTIYNYLWRRIYLTQRTWINSHY